MCRSEAMPEALGSHAGDTDMAHVQNRLTPLEGASRSVDMHIGAGLRRTVTPSGPSCVINLTAAFVMPGISEVSGPEGCGVATEGPLCRWKV